MSPSTAGTGAAPCYVGAALRRVKANLCACAAATAATFLLGACGGEDRRDGDAPDGVYTVAVVRSSFPAQQRIAKQARLVLTVRNTGDQAIPDLVVTVRGFTDRSGGPRETDLGRDVWIVDEDPRAAATAFGDTWTAGRLEPGRSTTLRWRLTPVLAGRHTVRYEIAPSLTGAARARLADGGARAAGTLRARVNDAPARARVDPRTGQVRRNE